MSGTDVPEDLVRVLKRLRLPGVLQTMDLRVRDAVEGALSYDEFLCRILRDELGRRDGKQVDQRIRRAGFEYERTLEGFDWAFNPMIPRERVLALGTRAFMQRRENVLFLGPTGTGKSHLAQALGHRACLLGSVRFVAVHDLLAELRAARGDGTWDRRLQRIVEIDLLIIDDLGYGRCGARSPTTCTRSCGTATSGVPPSSRRTARGTSGDRCSPSRCWPPRRSTDCYRTPRFCC